MAIYSKLLEFQKKNITIKRDGENPHFKSSYATLNEVLDKVKGPLNELGIVIIQNTGTWDTPNGSTPGLNTVLLDTEDDSKVECFVPFIGATDMQKLGGAITYARRYSLVSLLGLEDADDDGTTASAKTSPAARAVPYGTRTRTPLPANPPERNDVPFEGDIPSFDITN